MSHNGLRIASIMLLGALAALLFIADSAHADVSFPYDLHLGETDPKVLQLQVFLNGHGFPLAEAGSGSPGSESTYFGALTRAALTRFQAANDLPATGYFGLLTRAVVEAILEGSPVASPAPSTQQDPSQIPAWLESFNAHAPGPGWIPGFGGGSAPVSETEPPAPDTTPPNVSLTAPADGSTLAGAITLSANASDDVGVSSVQFAIDGAATGTAITSAPYAFTWDSTQISDASHTIAAVARDAAGNIATSSSVTITTENTPLAFSFFFTNTIDSDTAESISWTTSESGTTEIVWGQSNGGPYPNVATTTGMSTLHGVTITGLGGGGNFFYKAVSTNAAGITATSTQQSFTIIVLG